MTGVLDLSYCFEDKAKQYLTKQNCRLSVEMQVINQKYQLSHTASGCSVAEWLEPWTFNSEAQSSSPGLTPGGGGGYCHIWAI